MKIAILAKNANLYSHKRLIEAGVNRGHEIKIINTLHCYINVSESKPRVHYRGGEIIGPFDAVIPRIGVSNTFYGTAVLRQFEAMHVWPLNDSLSIARSRDKLRSLQLLSRKGIPMPITGFAKSPQDTEDLITMVGGPPLIIKLLEGTQGCGIVLAETRNAAHSVISAFKQLNANILVQEYIKEAAGGDIRCLVVGDRVVAAMARQAKTGDFRSNLHRGGIALPIKITEQERKMAITATRVMGLKVSGVDIIRSTRGPLILEVNSSPGLEGIETATGKDIASMIIKYLEKNAKPYKVEKKNSSLKNNK
ncbi:MAG: ribosomal protein S6 modification protein [Gammaproteobacteria bacterium RIFCSPHIGHO2_12_FULL_35_23]|nr:MAG: ribosomal protein S6 modification protein [Gammaproteobacteria bacterium RIFCSPHIGHO2_12_FULL_35_23]